MAEAQINNYSWNLTIIMVLVLIGIFFILFVAFRVSDSRKTGKKKNLENNNDFEDE
jgi:Na+/H+ antiporter NhaD/arsenite permease-like protein